MKTRFLLLALLGMVATTSLRAQEVFNKVVSNAKLVLEDPNADSFTISVSQFKYTAMEYLCKKAIKQNGWGVDGDFLDRQAYAMNHFIISYFSELASVQSNSNDKQKEVIKKYWKACADNPLFGDKDTETTEAFTSDPQCITPFSLDTNWEKADKVISKE